MVRRRSRVFDVFVEKIAIKVPTDRQEKIRLINASPTIPQRRLLPPVFRPSVYVRTIPSRLDVPPSPRPRTRSTVGGTTGIHDVRRINISKFFIFVLPFQQMGSKQTDMERSDRGLIYDSIFPHQVEKGKNIA